MKRKVVRCLLGRAFGVLVLGFAAVGADPIGSAPAWGEGASELKSVGALAFSDEGILFVGDSQSAAVFAFDLTADEPTGRRTRTLEMRDIDTKVASLFGTTPREIVFNDMAIHPVSSNAFFSISRGRGNDATPLVLRVGKDGSIEEVDLGGVKWTKAEISAAPAPTARSPRGASLRAQTITDLAFVDGELFVAGLSNEEFASTLRRFSYPFDPGDSASSNSVEIYHVAHGAFETHAPIRTFTPFELNGKAHIMAAYTCTPLVSIPVDALSEKKHVKGTTVAELGSGNRPLDMVSFSRQGKDYLLISNNNRSVMKIDGEDIGKIEGLEEPLSADNFTQTEGVRYRSLPMVGVLQMAGLGQRNVTMLQRDVFSGAVHMRTFSTQRF